MHRTSSDEDPQKALRSDGQQHSDLLDAPLPITGWDGERTLQTLSELRREKDIDSSKGHHQGWVYDPGDATTSVAAEAMRLYYETNPLLAGKAFPSLTVLMGDLVAIAGGLLNSPQNSGLVTTGGSESNLLGVWSAFQIARAQRDVPKPNIVVPYSAHPSFNKAGMYFGIDVRRAALKENFQVDRDAVARLIDSETVLLVGSSPDYSHGVTDGIPELAQLAIQSGLPLHVDACVGGFMLPFVERLGRDVPPWDFRVPGVCSISADIHKHGYGPKGVSVLLTDTPDRIDATTFQFSGWPHGNYITQTIGGTRSGGAIAGAWATFKVLGESGYIRLAKEVMEISDRFRIGIEEVEGLEVLGAPAINKFSYASSEVDIIAIADGLEERGWMIPRQGDPEAIGMHVGAFHQQAVDAYISDLGEVAQKVRSGELIRGQSSAAYN